MLVYGWVSTQPNIHQKLNLIRTLYGRRGVETPPYERFLSVS